MGISTVMRGPNGEPLAVDEEQRMRRLEKKELEKIARRFKVITPAEFERNLSKAQETGGAQAGRPSVDSWGETKPMNSNTNAANGPAKAGDCTATELMNRPDVAMANTTTQLKDLGAAHNAVLAAQ